MIIPEDIDRINQLFTENGYKIYLVGGCVRDMLMNRPIKDYDLATDALPEDVIRIFKDSEFKTLLVGVSFGVVVIVSSTDQYEVATFRTDGNYTDGRRPDEVIFSKFVQEDAARRDLTINALYFDLNELKCIDYVNGRHDIENRLIRTVGSSKQRFDEDKLRKLRTLRFASRFKFDLDEDIVNTLKMDNDLTGVSSERITDEFKKANLTSYYYELVSKFNLWSQIFPGLTIASFVPATPFTIRLALILRFNAISKLKEVLREMKYTNIEIREIIFYVRLLQLNNVNFLDLKKEAIKLDIEYVNGFVDSVKSIYPKSDPWFEMMRKFQKFTPSVKGDKFKGIVPDKLISNAIYIEELLIFKDL